MATVDSQTHTKPPQKSKEKLRSIMEAASALTALGDSSDSEPSQTPTLEAGTDFERDSASLDLGSGQTEENESPQAPVKRHIPKHKKPHSAPTFPEKLMNMMNLAEKHRDDRNYCVAWLPDGKSFVIRDPDTFTRKVLTKYFKATKFSSFTRKLYRWGFRQVNRGLGPDDPVIFGNEFFQRDNAELMAKMRSVTAAGTRKASDLASPEDQWSAYFDTASKKRRIDTMILAEQEQLKRLQIERLIREKAALGTALDESEAAWLGCAAPGYVSLDHNLNLANSFHAAQNMNASGNPFASASLPGFSNPFPKPGLFGGNVMPMYNANALNLYQAAAAHQALEPQAPGSSDIVNAAINALHYSG